MHERSRRRGHTRVPDGGMASMIGTILAVLGLVIVAGALAVTMLSSSPTDPRTVRLEPTANETSLFITHRGGEAIPTSTSHLFVDAGGTTYQLPLTDFESQLGTHWAPGDTLCLAGTNPGCVSTFSGQEITGVRLVGHQAQLFEWEGRVLASSPLPDLSANLGTPVPPVIIEGTSVSFPVTLYNGGTDDVDPTTDVVVRWSVNGTMFSETTVSGALLSTGASTVTTSGPWTASEGSHTITVTVDATDVVRESNEGDNQDTIVVHVGVFDPGFAYDDVDCSGSYNDGIDEEVSNEVQNGFYVTPNCLVIPPSEPGIHTKGAGSTIYYEAYRIYLGTDAHLSGTDGDLNLVSTTEGITGGDDVELFASGSGGNLHIDSAGPVILGENTHLKTAGSDGQDTIKATSYISIGTGSLIETTGTGGALNFTSNGDITIEGVTFSTAGLVGTVALDTTLPTHTIHVQDATFDDTDDHAWAQPDGVNIDGTPASGTISTNETP